MSESIASGKIVKSFQTTKTGTTDVKAMEIAMQRICTGSISLKPTVFLDSSGNLSAKASGTREIHSVLSDSSSLGMPSGMSGQGGGGIGPVSYPHLRAHETVLDLVGRLLLEKKKQN